MGWAHVAPTTGWSLTTGPREVRMVPVLCDKRLPPQQPLNLFTRRLPMTLNCPTWLGHRLGQPHALKHGVVHLKWVRDPSAGHARQFHTGSDPLFRGGWEFLKISCTVCKLWRHRGCHIHGGV